ncbi:MAG: thiamine-phosphate kinase [Planctomycetes bacterium]|nr:thiamine-phosphate kinase [Planctomycetota bacterium]
MREEELLAMMTARSRDLPARFGQVLTGPGDDCAVVQIGEQRLLLTVDQVIEGRHFRRNTSLDLVARKAAARSISDIAAMAGSPVCMVATAALKPGMDQAEADALYMALKEWAEHWECPLVGGDTATLASANDPLMLTVTAIGRVHPVRGAVLRSGAREGDGIYVTGSLGGSFEQETGLGRHLTFEPRLKEAAWLASTLGDGLHAMMDLSDGLGRDADRMARASGVRMEMDASAIPKNPGVRDWKRAAGDGEDYELLFAAAGNVPARTESGVAIAKIGVVVRGEGCVIAEDGKLMDAGGLGWEHR